MHNGQQAPTSTSTESSPDLAELGPQSRDLSLRQVVRLIRKRKRAILGVALSLTLVVLILSLIMPPYYPSAAVIEIERDQSNPLEGSLGDIASSVGGTDETKVELQTDITVLESDDLALETMEKVGYEKHLEGYAKGWFSRPIRPKDEIGQPLANAPETRKILLKKFSKNLNVRLADGTRIITITFEDRDRKFAAEVASTIVDFFVDDRLERRNSSTLQATKWMDGQIEGIKGKVDTDQQAVIDFQQKSGMLVVPNPTAPGMPGQTAGGGMTVRSPLLERVFGMNQNMVTVQSDRIVKEAIYQVAKSGDVDALIRMDQSPIMSSAQTDSEESTMFSGITTLRQQELALQVQLATAEQTFGPQNPRIRDLKRQIGEIHGQLIDEVKSLVDRANLDYQIAQKTEDQMKAALNRELGNADSVNSAEIHLATLQQEADSSRALFEDLYTKLEESKLQVGMQSANVGLISRALPMEDPSHPLPVLYTILAAALGLFIGVIAAFVIDSLDESLTTATEVEEVSGTSVIGVIPSFQAPFVAGNVNKDETELSWMLRSPNSQIAEAFRALRTSMLLSQAGKPPRTILISSSLPGEGKSTCSYNLAACFAIMGMKVIVIDADLRRSALHRLSKISNEKGLSNLLTGSGVTGNEVVQHPKIPSLWLLPAGPPPPNPSELLASPVFEALIQKFKEQYDLVLIDSPPSVLLADASILSRVMDGVVLVVRSNITRRSSLAHVIQLLHRSHARLLGIILNGMDTASSEYYYGYGYYGHEGYGYHGQDKEQ